MTLIISDEKRPVSWNGQTYKFTYTEITTLITALTNSLGECERKKLNDNYQFPVIWGPHRLSFTPIEMQSFIAELRSTCFDAEQEAANIAHPEKIVDDTYLGKNEAVQACVRARCTKNVAGRAWSLLYKTVAKIPDFDVHCESCDSSGLHCPRENSGAFKKVQCGSLDTKRLSIRDLNIHKETIFHTMNIQRTAQSWKAIRVIFNSLEVKGQQG